MSLWVYGLLLCFLAGSNVKDSRPPEMCQVPPFSLQAQALLAQGPVFPALGDASVPQIVQLANEV